MSGKLFSGFGEKLFDQFVSCKPPYALARMNEYILIDGKVDKDVNTMLSSGASDCIIFVCHNPTQKRGLMCHVDRTTNVDKLIEITHSFVTGGDLSTCNIYMISGVFCAQGYNNNGIYLKLKLALGGCAVETIGATSFALNIATGKIKAGAEPTALCNQIFPEAATTGGSVFAMIPSQNEPPTCVYRTKMMFALTGGRTRSSSFGSSSSTKKKNPWD